jgi:DNA-binding response OmpR family regulator
MQKNSNIILISDDSTIEESMSLKLIPLRELDSLKTVSYKHGFNLELGSPEVILVYCQNTKEKQKECIDLIKHLRGQDSLNATSILLITDNFDKEFAIQAYSEFIDDYIIKDSEKGSILIKLMWALKKSSLNKELNKEKDFLTELGIVDAQTGFYMSDYREKIFNHELKYVETTTQNSILMVGASDSGQETFNYDELVMSIKASLRVSDVIFQAPDKKIYIMLPNTTLENIGVIFKKITANLTVPTSIIGVATDINGKSFELIETSLISNIGKANFSEEGYFIISDGGLDDANPEMNPGKIG